MLWKKTALKYFTKAIENHLFESPSLKELKASRLQFYLKSPWRRYILVNFAKQFRKVVLENNVGVLMVVDLLRDCALIYIKVTRVSICNRDTMFIM